MRFQSHFNTAIKVIDLFDGSVPLSHYLKTYFSGNKKHGSKDRKFITQACYNYYRIGYLFNDFEKEEKLKVAIFLCNDNAGDWFFLYDAEWQQNWNISLVGRIKFIQLKYNSFVLKDIFPLTEYLSVDIVENDFIKSHLIQPDVFLRIRPHQYKTVINTLQQHEIPYQEKGEDSISVSNSTSLNNIIKIDEEVVIQDYSSQRIKEFLLIVKSETKNQKSEIFVWDCCSGSGGKSILAHDVLENIDLTVSDIRQSIIYNLKERFKKANIKNYKSFVADIANSKFKNQKSKFDLIICDAPCTGSGTWSRTPEQLYFFDAKKIEAYSTIQKKIVSNAVLQLKESNSYFLYITCSVFKQENEDIVEFIQNECKLNLVQSGLLKGYDKKADTMFAALFINDCCIK